MARVMVHPLHHEPEARYPPQGPPESPLEAVSIKLFSCE